MESHVKVIKVTTCKDGYFHFCRDEEKRFPEFHGTSAQGAMNKFREWYEAKFEYKIILDYPERDKETNRA